MSKPADYVGEDVNSYGTPVSTFRCVDCGQPFTVCPAVEPAAREEWSGCLSEDCASYEPTRDAELYMGLGMVEQEPGAAS